ncbi:MAG: T9SS type A sorting domain-containing protein, partial [Bacteroidota bacterium]
DGSCAMAIWANDFEGSPISDCTGQGPEEFLGLPRVTKYAIYRKSTVDNDPNFVPDPADTGLVLTDEDDGTTLVYVYAFDEEGNYGFCETYVLVQGCEDVQGASIAGIIATENNETVENVEVNLNGDMSMSMTTNQDGSYEFSSLVVGQDYSVTPYLNTGFLNGVSTFDLVLMSKHILGVDLLESPYKLIAADINRSSTITTLDMIQLRKLILNIDTEFSNNTSWRFVETAYEFPQPANPWADEFPELINFNNLSLAVIDADFVAVKIGDVNDSADANSLSGDDRTLNGIFNLEVDELEMKTGNTYTVSFTAREVVEGFQGTLALNNADLVDISYAAATAKNFGLRYAEQGMITMSFNETYNSNDVLFSLVVRATADVKLSDVMSIGSRYTPAEAYQNDNVMNLGVDFANELPSSDEFVLYQNTPNPFEQETLIGFYLPTAGPVTINIADVTGKQLMFISDNYSEGYNTLRVTSEMLKHATGVLSYTLTSGDFTATKKMIIVK